MLTGMGALSSIFYLSEYSVDFLDVLKSVMRLQISISGWLQLSDAMLGASYPSACHGAAGGGGTHTS